MKAIKIIRENLLSCDAPSGFIGEWAAVPDCINESSCSLICRKHGSNSIKVGNLEIHAFHDENPEAAIQDAKAEGLDEKLENWLFN